MNNIEKLKNYIEEFQNQSNYWFSQDVNGEIRAKWLKNKYDYFNYILEKLNDLELDDVEVMANKINGFNILKIAQAKATNFEKNEVTIEQFRATFKHLAEPINQKDRYQDIENRLKSILSPKGKYKISYWGIGAISELIGYAHPNNFIFFNSRERAAADYLNLNYKSNGSNWKQYRSFQEKVVQPFFEFYKKPNLEIIKDIPKGLLIDQFFSWIYETKVKNKEADSIIQAKIEEISIQNYYCLENISLPKLSKEVYIVGENGVGKTLLLQTIFWAAKHLLIENDPKNTLGTAWIKRNFSQLKDLKIKLTTDEIDDNIYQIPPQKYREQGGIKEKEIQNFFAYGVSRQYQKGNDDTYEFMSLFNGEVQTSLRNPMEWLQELKFQELEAGEEKKIYNGIKHEKAISFLEELLENVTIQVSSKGVTFKERLGEIIDFNLLSDGYKSVFTWLADLLSRLAENQPNADEIKNFKGVVLIDELDLFLHPKWSYGIVQQLRKKLPNIQFIITTHSPILILGAGKDAIFYKMFKEDGKSKILGPIENKNMSDKMANHVITAPFLFDLPTARQAAFDEKTQELDTSDDYLYSVIHEAIEKRLEEELKSNLTEDNIWKIVNELLEQELEKR
jgi:predicted ATP-binding protein involved in virulence